MQSLTPKSNVFCVRLKRHFLLLVPLIVGRIAEVAELLLNLLYIPYSQQLKFRQISIENKIAILELPKRLYLVGVFAYCWKVKT